MSDIDTGKELKKVRTNFGLPVEDMAEILGVSKSTMKKYESGDRGVSVDLLKKLAEIQPWTIDQIIFGEVPELDLSQADLSYVFEFMKALFPVFQPENYGDHKEFCFAVSKHKMIRDLLAGNLSFYSEKNLLEVISDLHECKKHYSLALHDNYFKQFAIVNLISLSLLYAAFIDERNCKNQNLLSYNIVRRFNADPGEINLFRKGVDFQRRNKELHSETTCKKLWGYIEYLESIEEFKEAAAFFAAFLLYNDIIYPREENVKPKVLYQQKIDELFYERNPFVIRLAKLSFDMYHIET